MAQSPIDEPDVKDECSAHALTPEEIEAIEPSWKPLLWFSGILVALIALWEVFLDFGMDLIEILFKILEKIWLVLIEAPEELLEDKLEDWLEHHFPYDADRYAEIATAIGLTPLKILLILIGLRFLYKYFRTRIWCRMVRWGQICILEVKGAWEILSWPYRILGGAVVILILIILI